MYACTRPYSSIRRFLYSSDCPSWFARPPGGVTVAMSRRVENCNELKLRVSDALIDAIRIQQRLHGYPSAAAAAVRLMEQGAFGAIGSLPARLADVSDEMSRVAQQVQ